MDFTTDVVDYGTSPEIHVSGMKSITRISQGIVRVTYFTEHEHLGEIERRVCLHVLWDVAALIDAVPFYEAAIVEARQITRRPRPDHN